MLAQAQPGAAGAAGAGHLRKGETFAELAAGFGVGTATAWRYVSETVALLAGPLPEAAPGAARMRRRPGTPIVVIGGTLIPVDRVAADRPFYSGKHRRHGMNLQVISAPDGEILWVSGPAARRRARPDRRPDLGHTPGTGCLRADRAGGQRLLGAGQHVATRTGAGASLNRRRRQPCPCPAAQPGERANAQLKTWRILRKLRCCPWKAGQLAKAIHVLQAREIAGCRVGGWRGGIVRCQVLQPLFPGFPLRAASLP